VNCLLLRRIAGVANASPVKTLVVPSPHAGLEGRVPSCQIVDPLNGGAWDLKAVGE